MVGFQTKLRHGEQTRVFRMIPGLERAEFARLGGLHRNTFINSPRLLDAALRLKAMPRLRFAGQITGVEGYVESAAIGLLAGRFAAAERLGRDIAPPPPTTALGALLAPHHRRRREPHLPADEHQFRPVPAAVARSGPARSTANRLVARRALADLAAWRERCGDGKVGSPDPSFGEAPMLTLYYAPGACSMASHIALEETGVPYEAKPVSLATGEHLKDEYLSKRQPARQGAGAADRRRRPDRERRDHHLSRARLPAGKAAAG